MNTLQEPRSVLRRLGLSDAEVVTYLAMAGGACTARDIIVATRQKRPTVYYALASLEKRGLVSRAGHEGEKRFQLEPTQRLASLVQELERETAALARDINALVPVLDTQRSSPDRPTVSFFEGVDAVKNVVMESLYCKGRHIDSVAPNNNFFWSTPGEFGKIYVEERVRRGIKTRNLWESAGDQKSFDAYYAKLSEVRILPVIMHGAFKTTTFLYDDKVLSVSSAPNNYCVLVTSQEYHDTMQAWFNGLWGASAPYPIKKK